jgi:hypothetical protein
MMTGSIKKMLSSIIPGLLGISSGGGNLTRVFSTAFALCVNLGGISLVAYGAVVTIVNIIHSYSIGGKPPPAEDIINNVVNEALYVLLTEKGYLECTYFEQDPLGILATEIINSVSKTCYIFNSALANEQSATAAEEKEAKEKFKTLPPSDMVTVEDYLRTVREASPDVALGVEIIPYTRTDVVSSVDKSKLVNLNIPMQSLYYALNIVKSTYNSETGDLLTQYYENKDAFMESYAKRKK